MIRPSIRWLLFSALACSGAPHPEAEPNVVPEGPAVFRYAGGTHSYTIASHRVIVQEIEGNENRIATALRARVTTNSNTPAADSTAVVTITVDTVLEAVGPLLTARDGELAAGASLTGRILTTGQVIEADEGHVASSVVNHLLPTFRQFFPRIPSEGLAAAVEWVDTTTATRRDGQTDVETTAIVTNRAGAWRDEDSTRVLTVSWVAEYGLSGSGEQLGQRFVLDGSGRRIGEHHFDITGTYRGGFYSDTSIATVTIASLGITFPLRQTGADTVIITHLIHN